MKAQRISILVTVLLFLSIAAISIYNLSVSAGTLRKQNVPMFVLRASESDVVSDSFANALATVPSDGGKSIYLSRIAQNVTIIDAERKTETKTIPLSSTKALAVNSQSHIFAANDSELIISDAQGKRITKFPIPKTTTSIAALSNGQVAVAATDSDKLITVFDESGNVIRRIGNLKSLDTLNVAQNRFLNAGKITANQSGELYHVSMFLPTPIVQKFSKQGELLKEFTVEGAAIDLQSKHADEFLKEKNLNLVGGFYVIKAANVDSRTGNLWIGMNGSSGRNSVKAESGVLYEYNSEGEKLAEYALSVSSAAGKKTVLTGIDEIAVSFPYVYVLSQGKVYRFDINQRTAVNLNH